MKPKSLFKRVFDFARSEIERRAKLGADEAQSFEYEPTHQEPRPASAPAARTSSLREPSGHVALEHAASVHTSPEATASATPADSAEIPKAQKGLEVVRTSRAGLKLAWSLSASDIERARALTEAEAVLCLRVVAFSPLRDDVQREVQDRPGVEREGRCELEPVDSCAVVAIGLRAGEHFVSIHHQTV